VHALLILAVALGAAAQETNWPHGMYNGGNELVFVGVVNASSVIGVVVSRIGREVMPRARVQAQAKGHTGLVLDTAADDRGRFKIPSLLPGEYWLGVSSPGFNLHYYDLRIERRQPAKRLQVELSVGT
jgi:hypothetical protein